MKTKLCAALCLLSLPFAALRLTAQTGAPAGSSTVVLQGLRSTANHGSFKAAHYAPDGSLLLLYDGGDGLRLLRTDAAGGGVLAEVQEGAPGDVGIAMTLDPAGNIYVVGTSLSGALAGTAGSVFPRVQDSSTNSFLAKFDSGLHLQFLTFLGAGKTAVTGVSATADAAFVTGSSFGSSFPTTAGAVLPLAAPDSTANGFIERFTADGKRLVYSTLITGDGGDSACLGIVADASDHAYVVGETSAASFPAVAALVPVMPGTTAGFVLQLTPAGDAFVFSSFVPGSGLTGIDLDSAGNSLFLTGQIAPGQFPIASVSGPIANTAYQSLLRWSLDGSQVLGSTLLAPGSSGQVTAAPDGTAWVSGSLGVPLFEPGDTGDIFLQHINMQAQVDVARRAGGMAVANAGFATLLGVVGAPAINAAGTVIALPGTVEATSNATPLLPRFSVPLAAAPNNLLPNTSSELLPASCDSKSQCLGSAGLLTMLQTSGNGPSLSLATGNFPLLTVRNDDTADATGVVMTASGFNLLSDCRGTVTAASQCGILLSGQGPGTLTVSSSGTAPQVVSFPASSGKPTPLLLSASELDFGIVTASSSALRTITVTNVSSSSQSFLSAGDGLPSAPPYALSEAGSTCAGSAGAHTVDANGSCTLTLKLAASSVALDDGPVHASWEIAGQDILVTGITQAADLSVSSAQIDFGTTFAASGTASLPRYLFISNSSTSAFAHSPVPSAGSGPFTVLDECPSTLEPGSVCRLTLTYTPVVAPSVDSTTLTLDGELDVLITGVFLAGSAPRTGLVPSPLSAAPASIAFSDSVIATAVSSTSQVVMLTNRSTGPVPLAVQLAGDFSISNPCGPTLSPGGSCELTVRFTPSRPGIRNGLLSITTGSGTADLNVPLSGLASSLLPPNNGILALGSSSIGEPVFGWYKVSAALDHLTVTASGNGFRAALVEDNGTGHGDLPASAFAPALTHSCRNCWLGLVLVPWSAGDQSGRLTLSSTTGGQPYQLSLTGYGTAIGGLVVFPSQADLGTVPVGSTSAPFVFTLANLLSPNAPVSILGLAAAGDFQIDAAVVNGLACVGLLNATASCRIAVTFSPLAEGTRRGTLNLLTSAGLVSVSLSGSAVANRGLAVNPTAISFDSVPVPGGASAAAGALQQSIQLTNTSGRLLTITGIGSTASSFTPRTHCGLLQQGASCAITVIFTPGDSEAAGSLNFSAVAGGGTGASPMPFSIPLAGDYTASEAGLVLLPAAADFGAQPTGTLGQIREFTLFNTSSAPQTVAINPPQNYPLAAPFTCTNLLAGESCTFSLGFLPEAGGALTGSVLAIGTAPAGVSSQAIGYLFGYGNAAGQLTLTGDALLNGAIDFGQVTSGGEVQQTLTLTNSGNTPLNVRRIAAGPPFVASTTCASALDPGAQCQVTLTYAPLYGPASTTASTLPRTDAETLTISSDAVSSPDEVDLTGSALPGGRGGSSPLASYTLSAGALTFPNTAAGSFSPMQALTVLNTGTAAITFAGLHPPQDYAASSTCILLQPGASCQISVSFQPPTNSSFPVDTATLAIQSNALNTLDFVSLLGLSVPTPLSVSNTGLDFGSLPIGDAASLQLSVTNLTNLPVSLGAITTTGDYTVQLGTCPAAANPLPAGQTCTMLVEFAPTANGPRSGLLNLPSDALFTPLTVTLNGVGISPRLVVSPASLNFGSLKIGTQFQLPLVLANSGTAQLTGVAATITGPGASDFAIAAPCSLATVLPGAGCTVQVSFSPSAAGNRAANLTLASNDLSGPTVIPMVGWGTPADGLSVTVDGSSVTTLHVKQGSAASFDVAVTPLGAFEGPVTLTCTSENPGQYASCTLLTGTMTLNSEAVASTGAISTLGPIQSGGFALGGLLGTLPLLLGWRRSRLRAGTVLMILGLCTLGFASGCGGPGSAGAPLTPRGTYLYNVTATAGGAAPHSAFATITLVVQ